MSPSDDWSDDDRRVLAGRASRLKQALRPEPLRPLPEAIVVSTGGIEVALLGASVHGVRRLRTLTIAHSGPPDLLGVFAYGQLVLPAFRLSFALGRPPLPAERPHVLVVGATRPELGLEVDRVLGIDLAEPSPTESPFPLALCGRTMSGVPVLDAQALLDSPRLALNSP